MPSGSDKHGSKLDDEMKRDSEALERSGKEAHAEEEREQQGADPDTGEPNRSGHRIAGSGSSADEYTYRDHGEEGGASHPKP
jgi:hypothetical protein